MVLPNCTLVPHCHLLIPYDTQLLPLRCPATPWPSSPTRESDLERARGLRKEQNAGTFSLQWNLNRTVVLNRYKSLQKNEHLDKLCNRISGKCVQSVTGSCLSPYFTLPKLLLPVLSLPLFYWWICKCTCDSARWRPMESGCKKNTICIHHSFLKWIHRLAAASSTKQACRRFGEAAEQNASSKDKSIDARNTRILCV